MRRVVIAHGGTGSKPEEKDGPDGAVAAGMKALREDGPMAAVVAACVVLEDDERFNAGTGSNVRFDGLTIEMDAAVMDSRKKYGAVGGVHGVRNPIKVAAQLVDLPNNILVGEGALRFARARGLEEGDPTTARAKRKWEEMIGKILRGEDEPGDNEWEYDQLRACWNYPRPFEEVFGDQPWPPRKERASRAGIGDTVGAVATDGMTFAAATSTGGTMTTLQGRVGDSPNIGTGIFAGEFGAIVLTGNGDHLVRERAATMVHEWMGQGFSARAAVRRLVARYAHTTDIWAAVIGLEDHDGGGNRRIAWSVTEE